MGWPTESEIGIAARIELTEAPSGIWKTADYSYNVTTLIERVIADMAAVCGRSLGFAQRTVTEIFDGGRYILKAKHPPIISVTSVTDNEESEELSLADEEYWIYDKYIKLPRPAKTGRVARKDTTPQRYTVVYVGGYDDGGTPLPTIFTDVCAEIATRILLRIDQQYRVYGNVDQFRDGEIRSVFADKDTAFADQYLKLSNKGMILRAVR